jgi:hypothetical protein
VNGTVVKTDFARKITVTSGGEYTYLKVTNTDFLSGTQISSALTSEEAAEIAVALIGDNATVITDLPEATLYESFGKTIVKSGNTRYYADKDPEYIETFAKEQLAIAKFIREHRAEEERLAKLAAEAEVVKEAKRNKRRDELVKEFSSVAYEELCYVSKQAFDRIIKLEEAQAV